MGFGCNAAGIVGCRIIDSPRERLIAMITNNFVPCNGRFPTLIAILSMFFVGVSGGLTQSVESALLLTILILLGVFMTFLVSKILSQTILKGVPSSFTLELPPYRRPQIGKVIVRSIFDRTNVCPGPGGGSGGTCRAVDLAAGQYQGGGHNAVGSLRMLFGSFCSAAWNGRRHFTGIYFGVAGQRDSGAHYDYGLSVYRYPDGDEQPCNAPSASGRKRVDLGNRCQRNAFFFDALALFDYLSYHSQRDPEYQVDGNIFFGAYGYGDGGLFFVPSSGTAIWIK